MNKKTLLKTLLLLLKILIMKDLDKNTLLLKLIGILLIK